MNAQKIPLAAGLWLVGVPIGSARDITLRALDVLASADMLVAEDTRSLKKLMEIHGVALEGRRILTLHDHSGEGMIQKLLDSVKAGQSVAYASEAGMPTIADPGFELVRAAQEQGIYVTSAPGPTAATTALSLGGLGTDSFYFGGFLPQASGARKRAFETVRDMQATLVFYESPRRTAAALADAADVLGPDRPARICRELTKKFEEIRIGSLQELAESADQSPPKGEVVLLIARALVQEATPEMLTQALTDALQTMRVKDAAKYVAEQTGAPRRTVYQMALALKD